MRYKELVERISTQTGIPVKTVRDVLFALPDILIAMNDGETVRVPFGTFRMTRRKERTAVIPTDAQEKMVPEQMVVKLRAGVRLRRKP